VEVPPRAKAALWEELRERYDASERWREQDRSRVAVRRTHELEHEIARLSALPDNPGRQSRIERLRSELGSFKGGVSLAAAADRMAVASEMPRCILRLGRYAALCGGRAAM
jgi:hypothetical protein